MFLINCEIQIDLAMSKNCLIFEILRTPEVTANPNNACGGSGYNTNKGATFKINSTKLYVPVVTVSINDNIRFLENIKPKFKRTTSWNK